MIGNDLSAEDAAAWTQAMTGDDYLAIRARHTPEGIAWLDARFGRPQEWLAREHEQALAHLHHALTHARETLRPWRLRRDLDTLRMETRLYCHWYGHGRLGTADVWACGRAVVGARDLAMSCDLDDEAVQRVQDAIRAGWLDGRSALYAAKPPAPTPARPAPCAGKCLHGTCRGGTMSDPYGCGGCCACLGGCAEAERLLAASSGYPYGTPECRDILAEAQVHATLATVPWALPVSSAPPEPTERICPDPWPHPAHVYGPSAVRCPGVVGK